ncbi:diacylglycerol/lipid kinase family protein [Chryseolinea lacunae]|uniref:Diacylglycerol kinase n=1 Tax=Chryseolinea lacunae TaxID=2801331 RepID=A0ABS1KXD9_9BACT|nr:diacylglycerol kinase family protein [Chryseolinea lacunae]MBL0743927.1 diacylglycerol kinase [Chryseolinea lacunae]
MKFIELIHNPKAGEGENTMADIVSMLTDAGYDCSHSSTPDDIEGKKFTRETDFLVVAGGDGTVRKTALQMMNNRLPMAILPMGTANNIARTLAIQGGYRNIIHHWATSKVVSFDVGKIDNLDGYKFFIEGMGFGVFPKMINEIHKQKRAEGTPEENLRAALELMREVVLTYKARTCRIEIDDAEHVGKYILVEVMNISSIGPNLKLAPLANPCDGEFEVVLVAEAQRDQFAEYLQRKIRGVEEPVSFNVLKAKKLKIHWDGKHVHVDDASITLDKPAEIEITLQSGGLSFMAGEEYGKEKAGH